MRPARENRRDVSRREDQRHGESRRPARGAACAERHVHRRRWQERSAGGSRRARQDGRIRQPHPQRSMERPHRKTYEALRYYSDRAMTFRFVSNVDGTDFVEAVQDLDPAETLFIVSSKTFTTLE